MPMTRKMKPVNEELRALLAADQEDRGGGSLTADALERDRVRLRRVKELLEAGAAEDLFCAAMILQHGSALENYWQAHELAKASADGGHAPARWLAAAAYYRWLMHQGEPQHFGTQYFALAGGPLRLWEVDPTTTDDERARWDVPPCATLSNGWKGGSRQRPSNSRLASPRRWADYAPPSSSVLSGGPNDALSNSVSR